MAAVAAYFEKKGIPAVTEVADLPNIKKIAQETYLTEAVPAVRTVFIPPSRWVEKVSEEDLPKFLEALTKPLTDAEKRSGKYKPPEAPLPEIDTKALAPRLSSFAGKTIIIYDNHGGYEKPMAGLAAQLKPLLPADTKIIYYSPTTTTWTPDDQKMIPKADAAIVGHGY